MTFIKISILFVFFVTNSLAQQPGLDSASFDFWVGKWQAEWQQTDGKIGRGTNYITKVLDGKVLEENFEISDGKSAGFKGKSLSVYNTSQGQWHQAWADNQGGYYDFLGMIDGDKKIFQSKPLEKNGKEYISRMVFKNITYESFTWDWESSTDGGKTWTLNWRISYKRSE